MEEVVEVGRGEGEMRDGEKGVEEWICYYIKENRGRRRGAGTWICKGMM